MPYWKLWDFRWPKPTKDRARKKTHMHFSAEKKLLIHRRTDILIASNDCRAKGELSEKCQKKSEQSANQPKRSTALCVIQLCLLCLSNLSLHWMLFLFFTSFFALFCVCVCALVWIILAEIHISYWPSYKSGPQSKNEVFKWWGYQRHESNPWA